MPTSDDDEPVADEGTVADGETVTWRQREGDLSWREIDEEVIILDLRSATYLRLNPAASVLWGLLDPGATLGQLTASLADHYEINLDQAHTDAAAFLDSCASNGIVEPRNT